MAIYDIYRSHDHGIVSRMAERVAHLPVVFNDWRARRATRKALYRLSDHELDDIGLHRGDIDAL